MSEILRFKTHVQIKNIIGKDLINDDNIAILELVKNSFDANAKKVTLTFQNIKENDDEEDSLTFSNSTSRLIIRDNGTGMSFNEIRDKWLNIAYSEKKTEPKKHKRRMAGAKGIGRFSCDRLGEYLNLFTYDKEKSKYILLKIDWKKFEDEDDKDKEIQSIELEYDFLEKQDLKEFGIKPFKNGVVLEIIKLRKKWTKEVKDKKGIFKGWDTESFVELKKYLEKLINPNQAFEINDFGIHIEVPEFNNENSKKLSHEKFIGKIENRIFEKLDFKSTSIESEILKNGTEIYTELKDKGETIFRIKEKNIYFPFLKDVKISINYLNPYAKAFFTRQTGVRSVDYGSVFLFINGFRIPPYGEVGDDWLGIDQRKNQGRARYLGLREIIGRIEILDDPSNPDFKIISNRSGIVKSESFQQLTNQFNNDSFFFKNFRRLERYVVDGLGWDSLTKADNDRINEISQNIISGKLKDNKLKFKEGESTKKKRISEIIDKIIGTKENDINEKYINEELVFEKIKTEIEESEKAVEELFENFETKKIDSDSLLKILSKVSERNEILKNKLIEFTDNSKKSDKFNEILKDLNSSKKVVEKQNKLIVKLKKELGNIRKKSETQNDETNEALEYIIGQNSFLKDSVKADTKELQSLLHHTEKATYWINRYLDKLMKGIEKEDPKEKLFEIISLISLENQKIFSFTKYHKSTKFNTFVKTIEEDFIAFTSEYINNVVKYYKDFEDINIEIRNPQKIDFIKNFSPIEIPIIIDNLLNNSQKSKAKLVVFTWESKTEKEIILSVKDDGKGIKGNIADKIFDFRFSTTKGSGLGLYHAKIALNKLKGEIKLNKENSDGAEFILTIKK